MPENTESACYKSDTSPVAGNWNIYLSATVARKSVIPERFMGSGYGLLVVVMITVAIDGCREAKGEDAS